MRLLDGDGRRKLLCGTFPSATYPISVTRSQARRIIALFEENGVSYHSPRGGTVWVITEYCQNKGIPYSILHQTNSGIRIQKET
jgi:hypothetical protein